MKNKFDFNRIIPVIVVIGVAFVFFYVITPRILLEDVYSESFRVYLEEEPSITRSAKGYELSFSVLIEPIDPLDYENLVFTVKLNPEVKKADSSISLKYVSPPYFVTNDEELLQKEDDYIVPVIFYKWSYPITNPYEVEKSLKGIKVTLEWDHYYQEEVIPVKVSD